MVGIVAGILVASALVGQGDGNGNADVDAFPASRAWLYIAIVGAGYMVSRGLAKAGSREPYWADENDLPGGDKHYRHRRAAFLYAGRPLASGRSWRRRELNPRNVPHAGRL
jgi:hypothetical protein